MCQVWGVLWNAFARLSVFLVAVLSISRTFSLKYPFRGVSKRLILGLIAGYAVLQGVQSTIPYWFGVWYRYYGTHLQCQWFYEVSTTTLRLCDITLEMFVFDRDRELNT